MPSGKLSSGTDPARCSRVRSTTHRTYKQIGTRKHNMNTPHKHVWLRVHAQSRAREETQKKKKTKSTSNEGTDEAVEEAWQVQDDDNLPWVAAAAPKHLRSAADRHANLFTKDTKRKGGQLHKILARKERIDDRNYLLHKKVMVIHYDLKVSILARVVSLRSPLRLRTPYHLLILYVYRAKVILDVLASAAS